MDSYVKAFLADEAGFILSAELVLITTVAVLGLTVMLVAVRDSIGAEMTDLADAFRNVDQSYAYGGMLGCATQTGYSSWTAGSHSLDSKLRQPGSELDIVVGDHVVGTNIQAIGPVQPRAVLPPIHRLQDHRLPRCEPIIVPYVQPQGQPHIQPPILEAPCLECPQPGVSSGSLPQSETLNSQVMPTLQGSNLQYGVPEGIHDGIYAYPPPYSYSRSLVPAGPLQVW